MTAYDGLAERLSFLTTVISGRDDLGDEPDWNGPEVEEWRSHEQKRRIEARNRQLLEYRELALGLPFSREQDEGKQKPFTTRLFSYLHNEFQFNSPRPIGRKARVTHLVFAPLYLERTETHNGDPAKSVGKVTTETLRWLWDHAIHNPAKEVPQNLSFRGGKDRVFQYVKELFDFSEPFITPKRSILARKENLLDRAEQERISGIRVNDQAYERTRALDTQLARAGLSNRLTNSVEYFWKYTDSEIAHMRWARHARPYQTFTFTHENPPNLSDIEFGGGGIDPFANTALHAFPSDLFDNGTVQNAKHQKFAGALGRYLQGANWLIVPIDNFLDLPVEADDEETLYQALGHLTHHSGESSWRARWKALLARLSPDKRSDPKRASRDVGRLIDYANVDPQTGAAIDRLVIEVTRRFLGRCFNEADVDHLKNEFVGFKCMDGRAYVFSNVRNNNVEDAIDPLPRDEEREYRDAKRELFSRSLILDCGMHAHQRGRLIQNMTEFAAERSMALLWLARFRLLQNALNVIEAKLNLAVSNYHNTIEQFCPNPAETATYVESVVPYHYWSELHSDVGLDKDSGGAHPGSARRERKLIIALEFLSSCLTILNDVVEGGIADRASRTEASIDVLRSKLVSIRETTIVGHQNLTDFIGRRFIPAVRVIGRTGERYRRLRERITEVADLINANLSAREWHEHQKQSEGQTDLLRVAEFFGEAALGYYGSKLLIDMSNSLCASELPLDWRPVLLKVIPRLCDPVFVDGRHTFAFSTYGDAVIYVLFVGIVVYLMQRTARRMVFGRRPKANWRIGRFLRSK